MGTAGYDIIMTQKTSTAVNAPLSGDVLAPLPTRAQLKALWHKLMSMPDTGNELEQPLAHFQRGVPLTDVYDWFRARHAELDAQEPCVVHVRFATLLGTGRMDIPGRDVRLRHDGFFVDGVVVPRLSGKTILGIRTKGVVYNEGGFRIRGILNGVHTVMDRRGEPAPDVEPVPPSVPGR